MKSVKQRLGLPDWGRCFFEGRSMLARGLLTCYNFGRRGNVRYEFERYSKERPDVYCKYV